MDDPHTSKLQGLMLLMFTVLIALVGIFVLIGLRVAWRRYLRRTRGQGNHKKERPATPELDPWDASARRLEQSGDYDPRIDTPLPDNLPTMPGTDSLDDPFSQWTDQREGWDHDEDEGNDEPDDDWTDDDEDIEEDQEPPFPFGKP